MDALKCLLFSRLDCGLGGLHFGQGLAIRGAVDAILPRDAAPAVGARQSMLTPALGLLPQHSNSQPFSMKTVDATFARLMSIVYVAMASPAEMAVYAL